MKLPWAELRKGDGGDYRVASRCSSCSPSFVLFFSRPHPSPSAICAFFSPKKRIRNTCRALGFRKTRFSGILRSQLSALWQVKIVKHMLETSFRSIVRRTIFHIRKNLGLMCGFLWSERLNVKHRATGEPRSFLLAPNTYSPLTLEIHVFE